MGASGRSGRQVGGADAGGDAVGDGVDGVPARGVMVAERVRRRFLQGHSGPPAVHPVLSGMLRGVGRVACRPRAFRSRRGRGAGESARRQAVHAHQADQHHQDQQEGHAPGRERAHPPPLIAGHRHSLFTRGGPEIRAWPSRRAEHRRSRRPPCATENRFPPEGAPRDRPSSRARHLQGPGSLRLLGRDQQRDALPMEDPADLGHILVLHVLPEPVRTMSLYEEPGSTVSLTLIAHQVAHGFPLFPRTLAAPSGPGVNTRPEGAAGRRRGCRARGLRRLHRIRLRAGGPRCAAGLRPS